MSQNSEKETRKQAISPETRTKDMDDAVLATTPTNALWNDHHSIEEKEDNSPMNDAETLPKDKEDPILDHAIHNAINNTYPDGLSKEKKRAVRKRAATLVVDSGEVYLKRKNRKVKVVQSRKDQLLIVKACHLEPTSGHFGLTKTWRRIAERFYWKGMVSDVHDHVSSLDTEWAVIPDPSPPLFADIYHNYNVYLSYRSSFAQPTNE